MLHPTRGPVNAGRPATRPRLRPREPDDLPPMYGPGVDAGPDGGPVRGTRRRHADGSERQKSKVRPGPKGMNVCIRGVFLHRAVLLVCRTAAEDRVLGDLVYWTVPRADGTVRAQIRDGRPWVWRVLPRYAERLGLSLGQLRQALITLRTSGYVDTGRSNGGRTLLAAVGDRIVQAAGTAVEARGLRPPLHAVGTPADRWRCRKGVYVPDWVLHVADTAAEQRFLGQLAYWLGPSKTTGRLASGFFQRPGATGCPAAASSARDSTDRPSGRRLVRRSPWWRGPRPAQAGAAPDDPTGLPVVGAGGRWVAIRSGPASG